MALDVLLCYAPTVPKARFEWDAAKDRENRRKHGVSFAKAQLAFVDPKRVIARDASHSSKEERCYCFGEVEGGVLTVRFTYRDEVIRIYGAGGTGEEGSECMREKITYTDEPLGKVEIVPDFLPPPEDLVFRDEGIKVTIALSKRSVDFFKAEARKHRTQYQRMIRRLLDAYAEHHTRSLTGRSGRRRKARRA
jgi:uncharacterized DUF497 family protein